jgi:2-amino-4-hydroxy-6-hydroxymethyldihydropteridine diphosphokinase
MTEPANTISAWIALGANLGEPRRQLEAALLELDETPGIDVLRRSSWYRSAPFGPVEQDDFINGVAELHTRLGAHELLDVLQAIETAHGRRRELRWGPRTLDLDILLYADRVIETDRLTVPHPGIRERNFVLYPLHELEPDLEIPGLESVARLVERAGMGGLTRLAD